MSISNKFILMTHPYTSDDRTVTKLTKIKDLWIYFDTKLTFEDYIVWIVERAYKILASQYEGYLKYPSVALLHCSYLW